MECHRAQTIGWAAFDRIHREKLQKAEVIDDPFPSISNVTSADTLKSSTNNYSGKRLVPIQPVPATSFSAVVRASAAIEFPLLKAHTDIGSSNVSFDGDQHPIPLKHNASSVEQLKSIHGWPDQLLIEDILANVNNDVGQASLVLEEMFASDSRTKMEVTGSSGLSTSVVSCGSELEYNIPDLTNSSVDNGLLDNPQKSLMMKHFHVPIEPEWEEDCAYLSKRKEAIKITRAATQHSRSACNAYLRGDHCSAQQLSLRAKKEWMNAQHLHEMAAEEILRTRNSRPILTSGDLRRICRRPPSSAFHSHGQTVLRQPTGGKVEPVEVSFLHVKKMINLFKIKDKKSQEAGNANGRPPIKKQSPGELRLHKDISELNLPKTTTISFPNGKDDLLNFEIIVRPDEGYYLGGSFIFTFQVPLSYPHEPPKVKCKTKVYHPNIDLEGNVCLNILREDWKPVLNINTIIYGLNHLFTQPNHEDPLNHDAAIILRDNPRLFETNVRRAMAGGYVGQVHFPRCI